MLPFLKSKHEAGVSGPVEIIDREPDEFDPLESAMQELHGALHVRDYKSAAEIFRSAFELMDSQPHEEGPHIG